MSHRPMLRAAWSFAALLCLPAPLVLAETADELYARGLKLYLSGEYGKATAEVQQALQEDPGHTQAKQLLQVLQESKEQGANEGGVLSQLSTALEAQQHEGRRLKVVLANAEQRITALTASQQQDQAALAGVKKQLIASQQETDQIRTQLGADLAALQGRLTATDAKLAELEKAGQALESDRAALTTQLAQTQRSLSAAQQQARAAESKFAEEVEASKRSLAAIEAEASKVMKDLTTTRQEKEQLGKQLSQTKDELVAAKNEIGQLKVASNELDQLQRTHDTVLKELDQVKKERAQLKEQAASLGKQLEDQAKLMAQIKDAEGRIAQRDDQLLKLRGINATLEKQYGSLEVITKQQEANIQALEQKRAVLAEELAKTQEAAAAAQERARQEFGSLQQEAKDTKQLLAAELDQAKAREQEYVKEVEALRSAQVALEERLTDTRQKGVSVEAELTDARKLKLALEDSVKAREAQLMKTHEDLAETQRALTVKAGELQSLDKTSASDKETIQNLQQQLRIAKETQARLTDQVKDFQAVKADRDKLAAMIEEREQAVNKLQGAVAGTARDLEAAKRQIQLAEQAGQEQAEQLRIDQKGKEWKTDSLDREVRDLRTAEAKLKIELEQTQKKAEEQSNFREKLVKKLQERESQLKQAESVIKLLQGGQAAPAAVAVPEVTVEPIQREQRTDVSAPVPDSVIASAGRAVDADHPIKIFQVNDELQFVVFSLEGMEGAATGSRLLLLAQDRPIAAVQVTELDGAGFAVAQIVQMIEPPRPIRKGDLLFARPLPPS